MTQLKPLAHAPRLLIEAQLKPAQSERFQPTGFPDLGPASYTLADGTSMLLVESAQSMANRAETACWDEARAALVAPLDGLPYVHVDVLADGKKVATTASLLEAHRLNSPYVLGGELAGQPFLALFLEASGFQPAQPVDRARFLRTVFRYDPASLLHGLFMSNVEDGRMRLPRAMSSFIEARDVRVAQSGGVKNDRLNPSGDTKEGFGNVPYPRTEFTAGAITAFFNLDLRQLRSYGLPDEAFSLLVHLALYKWRRLLRDQLRLRTACDLDVAAPPRATQPEGFAIPTLEELEAALPSLIAACRPHFADPPVTRLSFTSTRASAKASKKAEKERADKEKADKARAKPEGESR